MRFALINPNWNFEGSIYFGCREAHLPLEFGYSAALLRQAGHEALIIDAQMFDLSLGDIYDRVQEFAPHYTVVTSAPSYLFWRCAPPELACPQKVLDAVRPVAGKTILVGPHASTTPETALLKTGVGIVVLGECEEVLVQIAEKPLAEIASIGYQANGTFVCSYQKHSANMAALPALKWSREELRLHRHHHHRFDIKADGWGAEMETSRGCPYSCSFCAKENFRNKYRKRPLPVILEELDALIAEGATYVYFIDEIFLPNRELLEAVKERPIQFGVQTRIDLWDYDMLQLLGEAGCVSIEAGVESITEEGRSELNKNCKMSTEEMTNRLVHARKWVPFVQANLIEAGTDDMESVETWRQGLQATGVWANKPVPLFPYPGSPDYTKRWGMPDDVAWERAHRHYLNLYDEFSDVQEARPLELSRLERSWRKPGAGPLRVLMTCDTVGGVWTYAMDLCRALEPDAQILLAVLGPKMSLDQRAEVDQLNHVMVEENYGRLEWMDNAWEDVDAAQEWLLNLADTFEPDVVHLNGYAHARGKWSCPVVVVAHSDVYSWWEAVNKALPPVEFRPYLSAVKAGVASASCVVAPTRAMLEAVDRHYGLDGESRVIYNGRDGFELPSATRETFIFSAGRAWDQAKNFALLDRIAPQLPWPVKVAGESRRNGWSLSYDNLFLLGRLNQEEMKRCYETASIFVSPAYYEPFGLCVLEAALHGCPLVLSDIASLREVWGDAAIYVDPRDGLAMLDALNRLIHDEALRTMYSRRARARAMLYTATRMAASYLELYRELTSEPILQELDNVDTSYASLPVSEPASSRGGAFLTNNGGVTADGRI